MNLDYFVGDDGFAKAMCKMPGDGPTWIFGLTVLRDAEGRERLFCGYMKVRNLLEVYERGIAEFDDERQEFVHRQRFDKDVPLFPDGHSLLHKIDGVEYVYFSEAAAVMRVRATVEAFAISNSTKVSVASSPADVRSRRRSIATPLEKLSGLGNAIPLRFGGDYKRSC